jgi:uncharacterized membrane protein YeiH
LLFALDITGTVVFALEGATSAMAGGLDVFGVMVLSFATALGGGVIRDLLIGATPPAALLDWRYPVVAFLAGGIAFAFHGFLHEIPPSLLTGLDAAGLALFAVAGADKALAYRINPFVATLLGTITGVGGGTIRDVLLAQVPAVLRVDVYATAALAGAAVMVIGVKLHLPPTLAAFCGVAVCFALRMTAVTLHWNLPHAVL